jgi:SPP1 gp7 family putative phage head morphogenesis protein
MWDDDGQMIGFKFSNMPIPHFDLISAASAYGYLVIPGHIINSDYAVWVINEKQLGFGNVFGSARTDRAYRYWWSYWARWNWADRSYENLADPAKYVYYPVEFDEFIDPDDPNQENPLVRQARQTAIDVGNQIRSGSTVAFPGSFETGTDGRSIPHRRWEAGYFETKNNFSDLDATFKILDIMKMRAFFVPEESVIEGAGNRTSGGSAGGTGGARMATSLANVHEESQQVLVGEYDDYINAHFVPQFIAANFPEKIGTPCEKETRAMGGQDDQVLSQVLTLIGQVHGEVLPVDVRALLKQLNVPILNKRQMRAEIAEISKLAQVMGPQPMQPQKVGTQGYNSGVVQTSTGNFYMQPPQRIDLSNDSSYLSSLPDTPHFKDPGVRAKSQRLRRVMRDRYDEQYRGFADFLELQPTLHLAQANGNGASKPKSGLSAAQAKVSAATIVAAWAGSQAPKAVGSPAMHAAGLGSQMADLVGKIALDGGRAALKGANLHAEDFDAAAVEPWVQDRVKFAYDSIDQTVRDELQEWLADELQQTVDPKQVAAAAREHFADFPQTHADRVARTETTDAFNQGTAEACERAGVTQLQLHDASDGTDTKSDSACLARNGKIVSAAEAKNIHTLHPRCTIYMTPLSTENLSVQHVEEIPPELAAHGEHVAYDGVHEVLYLDSHVDEQVETAVMLMIGDQLELS